MMGLVQALFEGSMMTWIVVWVPAIQNAPEVCLTACCMSYEVCMLMRYSMTMDESRCYAYVAWRRLPASVGAQTVLGAICIPGT